METVKRKSGNKFREKIVVSGKCHVSPWFRRKTDARDWKAHKLSERERCGVGSFDLNDKITTDELFERYLASRQDRARRTLESYISTYRVHIKPVIGDMKLKQVRVFHGEEVRLNLSKSGVSPSRSNNVLVQLKVLFNFAVKQAYLHSNPFKQIDPIKQDKREILFWNNHEVSTFLEANRSNHYLPLFIVLLNTGMRKSEACGLMWDCVDFEQELITIKRTRDRAGLKETTKGRESRVIPINKTCREALELLWNNRKHPSYVFTGIKNRPLPYEHITDREFARAVKLAGVKRIRLHDLRTTYASHFCINGGNILALSRILGHKSVTITQKFYASVNSDFLKAQSQVIEFGVGKLNSVENGAVLNLALNRNGTVYN
jgi:integrase